jgi:hypothetical protein
MYRVWTKDFPDRLYCHTDWQSYGECRRFILARWRHWPPFAFISKCQDSTTFRRYHGE